MGLLTGLALKLGRAAVCEIAGWLNGNCTDTNKDAQVLQANRCDYPGILTIIFCLKMQVDLI